MGYFQNKCYILIKFNEKQIFLLSKTVFGGIFKRGFAMSAEKMPQLQAVGESHMGCVRTQNEDNFFVFPCIPGIVLPGLLMAWVDTLPESRQAIFAATG